MNILPLLLQLVSGVAGGNLVGAAFQRLNQGPIGNSLIGLVGGGIGGQILQDLTTRDASAPADMSTFFTSISSGGVSGALLLALIGWIKNAFAGKPPPL